MRQDSSATGSGAPPLLGPGVWWGGLGVVGFSGTFIAAREALPAFGPVTVGVGRAVPAAVLAGLCLWLARSARPTRAQVSRLLLVAAGVVVGFPALSALALQDMGAGDAAVLNGLLPAATAALAVVRAGERPRAAFWVACAMGAGTVLVFAATRGAGALRLADVWMLLAVLAAAVGYTEGGALARELGGWQVVSWALLLALPLTVPGSLVGLAATPAGEVTGGAVAGMVYLSAVSMFAGFVAWYRGLAEGGIAAISQLQLLQPVLTLVWAVLLLDERVGPATVVAAVAVIGAVALAQRTRPAPVGVAVEPSPVSGSGTRPGEHALR